MKYFNHNEFWHSNIATMYDIVNVPPREELSCVVQNITRLVDNVLDPLREEFGIPIIISSGYRNEVLNEKVGGVPSSQHRTGQAADIYPRITHRTRVSEILRSMFCWVQVNCDFDQLILYRSRGFIHVSFVNSAENRHQIIIK